MTAPLTWAGNMVGDSRGRCRHQVSVQLAFVPRCVQSAFALAPPNRISAATQPPAASHRHALVLRVFGPQSRLRVALLALLVGRWASHCSARLANRPALGLDMAFSLLHARTMWRSDPTKHRDYAALMYHIHQDQPHRLEVADSRAGDPLSEPGATPPKGPADFATLTGRSTFAAQQHEAPYKHVRGGPPASVE